MADKNLLQLPLATTSTGALLYGIQDNQDKAFTPSVLMGGQSAQAANFVYAGPVAPPGALPSFRKLVPNDIPDLSAFYMKTTGGALVSPVITNPTITGGSISGTNIIADDDKWRMRNATDTTKQIRFDVSNVTPGTTRTFNWPNASGDVVVTNATQDLTNKLVYLRPSANTGSSFRIPHGQPPAAPEDGDIWTTAGGMYARISGVTVGPLAAEQTSYVTSFNTRVGAITLLPADITNALGYTPWNTNTNLTTSANLSIGSLTTTGPNTLNGETFMAGVATVNNDFYVKGAIVTGTNANANLTIASDTNNVYVEAINRISNTRKTLNLYCTQGTLTCSNGQYYIDKGDGSNKVRFFSDGTNMQLHAVNSGANAFTPMIITGYEVQLRSNGGTNLTLSPGVNNGGVGIRFQANMASSNPSSGVNSFGFVSSGSWGGGYGMIDGGFSSGIYMEAGAVKIGFGNVGAALNSRLSLDQYGNFNVTGVITAGGGFGPSSDPKLKDKKTFRPIDNAVQKLYNLNVTYGKYHDWHNDDGKERVFLMADEAMKQNLPQAVLHGMTEHDGVKYDGWSADQVIAMCVKAIQELSDEVDNLKERINELAN